jgi:hypothetical protein
MLRRMTTRLHPRRKAIGKSKNLLRRSPPAAFPPFHFQFVFQRNDYGSGKAFAPELRKFGRKRIGPRVLEIETLQNSTLKR